MRSKQGMLAKISRSFKPAFERKPDNIRKYLHMASSRKNVNTTTARLNPSNNNSGDTFRQTQISKPREPMIRFQRGNTQNGYVGAAPQYRASLQTNLQDDTLMIQSRQNSYQEVPNAANQQQNLGASYHDQRQDTQPDRRGSHGFDSNSAISGSDPLI